MLTQALLALTLVGSPLSVPADASAGAQLELDVAGDFSEIVPVQVDEQRRRPRRRKKRRGKYRPKYKKAERTLGFQLQSGITLPIGKTIGNAYNPGVMTDARFAFHLGDGTLVYIDARWSYHVLRDARPLFFRTAVTPSSSSGGTLHTVSPIISYGYAIPLGYGFQNRARVNPKFYFGAGPTFTFAQAFVTETGQKGTVTGEGTQAFLSFVPGLGLDIRLSDFFFIGVDARYHLTMPLARPSVANEFTIPRMMIFESGIAIQYYFY